MARLQQLLAMVLASTAASAIQLWGKPGEIPTTVPAKCRAALTTNITCDFLVTANKAVSGQIVSGMSAESFCGAPCVGSMADFQRKVIEGCGNTQYMLWENSTMTQSGQALADGLSWAQRLLCIQDKSVFRATESS